MKYTRIAYTGSTLQSVLAELVKAQAAAHTQRRWLTPHVRPGADAAMSAPSMEPCRAVGLVVDKAQFTRLRELRHHHWRLAIDASPRRYDKRASRHTVEKWNAQWALHMGFVQALNAFFPLGDTAERDAAGVRRG